MRSFLFAGAAAIGLAVQATAQETYTSSAYTDPNTGIDFQRFYENSQIKAGYSFGLVLPEKPTTDFIGQLVVPLNSSQGWGAVSLGGAMTNTLLFTAWTSNNKIMTSFREATAYATPPVYTATTVTASPIANGTFINTTHFSCTFLCSGCILGNSVTFGSDATNSELGYAVSATNPTDPTDPGTAFSYHDEGYGEYNMAFVNATSPQYATWASWATASSTASSPSSPAGSNSTSPAKPTGPATVSNATYDVIVVGGGPSGIITAERLAENGASVLLLERGQASTVSTGSTDTLPWNDTLTPYDLPALGSSLTKLADVNEFCDDTASTAGCLLGGSSSINALNFIHPPEHDFERWPTGWKWADVSGAATRLYARNPGTTMPSKDGKHYDQSAFNIVSNFLKTRGWTQVDSIQNANAKTLAFSQPAWSILNSKRAGPVRTYLPVGLALKSKPLTLKLNTKVTNVIRTGSTITGVLTTANDGSSMIINVNKGGKVVLAAGALSTPRILWNSGIGLSDALNTVKSGTSGVVLPSESDWISLPVGHNMKDHPQYVLPFNSKNNFTALNWGTIPTDPSTPDQTLYDAGSGPLVQASQRLHMWTSDSSTLDGVTRYFQGTVSALASGVITMKMFLTHGGTSTGVLGISPEGNTIVQTAPWMNTAADRQAMTNFLQWLLDSTNAANSTMAYSGGSTNASTLIDSRITGDHWTGTARMGTDDGRVNNGTSVVDTNTKVYGTDNLFVVDASIHPDLPTGNTQAIIMVVAEQAAAKIAAYKVTSGSGNSSALTSGPSSALPTAALPASVTPATLSTVTVPSSSTSATRSACRHRHMHASRK
ncbi:MAG: hypothetical protein Q9157_004394 [Trypethelium eluteriae]